MNLRANTACRGPHENYVDQKASAAKRLYHSTVQGMHVPYIYPSECGGREDTQWVALRASPEALISSGFTTPHPLFSLSSSHEQLFPHFPLAYPPLASALPLLTRVPRWLQQCFNWGCSKAPRKEQRQPLSTSQSVASQQRP